MNTVRSRELEAGTVNITTDDLGGVEEEAGLVGDSNA